MFQGFTVGGFSKKKKSVSGANESLPVSNSVPLSGSKFLFTRCGERRGVGWYIIT